MNSYGPYALCFILTEFEFYLDENGYINDIIEMWKYTNNSVLA